VHKSIFQTHGINVEGNVIVCYQLKGRRVLPFLHKQPPCPVGLEACASS
jgi:transposase